MTSEWSGRTEWRGVALTQKKYCMRPGLYCGLILLTSVENAERGFEFRRSRVSGGPGG